MRFNGNLDWNDRRRRSFALFGKRKILYRRGKWNSRFFLNVRVRRLITTDRMTTDLHQQASFVTNTFSETFDESILIFADRLFSRSSVEEHPGGPEGRQKARGWITLTDQKRADHLILLHSRMIFQRDLHRSHQRRKLTNHIQRFAPHRQGSVAARRIFFETLTKKSVIIFSCTGNRLRGIVAGMKRFLNDQRRLKRGPTDEKRRYEGFNSSSAWVIWPRMFSTKSSIESGLITCAHFRSNNWSFSLEIVDTRRSVSCPWIDSRDELWSRPSSPLSAPQEEWCQTSRTERSDERETSLELLRRRTENSTISAHRWNVFARRFEYRHTDWSPHREDRVLEWREPSLAIRSFDRHPHRIDRH